MSSNISRTQAIIGGIAASLFVTVLGGLMVEWLKPAEPKPNPPAKAQLGPPEPPAIVAPPPSEKGSAPGAVQTAAKPTAIGKWRHGEKSLEVFLNGHLVIEYEGKSWNYPITTDDKGFISAKKGDVTIETVSVSQDELVLHWHERFTLLPDTDFVERYQRVAPSTPWSTTQIVLAVIGSIVGVVVVLGCIGAIIEKNKG